MVEAEIERPQFSVKDFEQRFNSRKRIFDVVSDPVNRERADPKNYAGPADRFNENLKCGVCKMVANDPTQCDECEELFCR